MKLMNAVTRAASAVATILVLAGVMIQVLGALREQNLIAVVACDQWNQYGCLAQCAL